MRLPEELARALRAGGPEVAAYLATAGRDGRPNLLPLLFTDVAKGEYVLSPDLFAQKTKVNLNENLAGALSVEDGTGGAWVVEGPCNVFQWGHPPGYRFQGLRAGDVLERWGDWDRLEPVDGLPPEARPAVFAQRGVLVLRAERVRREEAAR